jgi:uncharacterized protein
VRAILDPNVIISALLTPSGTAARILGAWLEGRFDLVASPMLLAEVERALAYPKLRRRVAESDGREVIEWIRRSAVIAGDSDRSGSVSSRDPGDEYLIALLTAERALLVSGDEHLLELGTKLPIFSPAAFLGLVGD